MKFDKPTARKIRDAMQEALDKADVNGVTIKVGNCSFTDGEATYKIQVLLDGAETQEQNALSQMAGYFNLDTTKIAEIQGHKVSLYGYNSKARKMPWQVQSLNGKDKWKLTDEQVRRLFEKDYVS